LPQLLTANFTERLRYKKWFVVLVSGPASAGPGWCGPHRGGCSPSIPHLTLLCIFAGVAVAMISAGTANPAWTDLIAKVIPVQKRGLWAGVSFSLGALLGVGGAALAGEAAGQLPLFQNFASVFWPQPSPSSSLGWGWP